MPNEKKSILQPKNDVVFKALFSRGKPRITQAMLEAILKMKIDKLELDKSADLLNDNKDDKKDDSTGGGEQEDKKPVDTKPTDKKPTDTKNNGISGSSNSGTKTDVSTGNSQGTKADLTGTTNGTAAAKTADMQKNVTYFMAAIVSGAVLLILADNRRKRKHGE